VGEAGAVAAPIAVMNALHDAIGMQLTSMPTTPETLVRAIATARGPRVG
jgi:carbon-monoxide dehydrogenase large subunit